MKRKVTAKDLDKLGACYSQRILFSRTFPDGAYITLDNLNTARDVGLDIDWLLDEAISGKELRKHQRRNDSNWRKYWDDKIDSEEYHRLDNDETLRALKEGWSPVLPK